MYVIPHPKLDYYSLKKCVWRCHDQRSSMSVQGGRLRSSVGRGRHHSFHNVSIFRTQEFALQEKTSRVSPEARKVNKSSSIVPSHQTWLTFMTSGKKLVDKIPLGRSSMTSQDSTTFSGSVSSGSAPDRICSGRSGEGIGG